MLDVGGANVNELNSEYLEPPILIASKNGHTEVVQFLLSRGANVNIQNAMGMTDLLWASVQGHTKIVQLLIGQPFVDLNIKNHNGSSPLFKASENGHLVCS